MSAKETFGPIDQLCGGVGQTTTVNSRPSVPSSDRRLLPLLTAGLLRRSQRGPYMDARKEKQKPQS